MLGLPAPHRVIKTYTRAITKLLTAQLSCNRCAKRVLPKCSVCARAQFDTHDLDYYYSASVLNITFLSRDFGKRSLVTGEK